MIQGTFAVQHEDQLHGAVPEVGAPPTCRSDSPMYMLMSSGPFTLRKLMLHSVATALATRVLPVPEINRLYGITLHVCSQSESSCGQAI